LDISIMTVDEGKFRVVGTGGDNQLVDTRFVFNTKSNTKL
jgi:hypothetical protein